MDRKRLTGGWLLVLALAGASARAQTPPERLIQDQFDLQTRANVVQGSGARAYGMGGAFLARADDATAASWNPAGLSYLRLPELSAVWSASWFDGRAQPPAPPETPELLRPPTTDERHGDTPDFFAATYPIQIGGTSGSAQLSFQRMISFKSGRSINEPVNGAESQVTSRGGFDTITFGTGLQVTRRLRLGVTVNHWFNGFTQHKDSSIDTSSRIGTRQHDAHLEISGWNANLGAIWSLNDKINVGVVAKSPFTADVRLERDREDEVAPPFPAKKTANDYSSDDLVRDLQASRYAYLFDPAIGIDIDFPAAIGFGLSARPVSPLTISADYTRTFWSKGRIHNFFTLPREGRPLETAATCDPLDQKCAPGGPDFFPVLPYPTLDYGDFQKNPGLLGRMQQDTEQIRLGVEYVVLWGRIKWPLRVGYFNDRQFFRDYYGAAPRFTGLTAGTGLILGPVLLDAAYVYEGGTYRDQDSSRVRIRSHRVFASLIYRHPRH